MSQDRSEEVKKTIDRLFTGMRNSDEAAILSCFATDAVLQSVAQDKDGNTTVKSNPISGFAASISKLPKQAADERIQYEKILIDGNLAFAWTPYEFHYNGKFSHCGVNAFTLVYLNGDWKINHIIDTRRKENCK